MWACGGSGGSEAICGELKCWKGGQEFLRTEREAAAAEEDEDDDDDDEDEAAADIRAADDDDDEDVVEDDAADEFCDDDEDADCVDAIADWACDFFAPVAAAVDSVDDFVVATLSLIVAMVGPGGPPITCMGCGGGESGQVGEKRLMSVPPLLLIMGGGDNGISTMGLGERAGTKSDWPLER